MAKENIFAIEGLHFVAWKNHTFFWDYWAQLKTVCAQQWNNTFCFLIIFAKRWWVTMWVDGVTEASWWARCHVALSTVFVMIRLQQVLLYGFSMSVANELSPNNYISMSFPVNTSTFSVSIIQLIASTCFMRPI